MSLMLLHDASTIWLAWCDTRVVRKLWKITSEFGIGGDDVEFVPYWASGDAILRVAAIVRPSADVLLSTYVRRGRAALAVLGNVSKEEREVTIKLSPQALGLGSVSVRDPYADTAIAAEGNTATLAIRPRNFRLVLVSAAK